MWCQIMRLTQVKTLIRLREWWSCSLIIVESWTFAQRSPLRKRPLIITSLCLPLRRFIVVYGGVVATILSCEALVNGLWAARVESYTFAIIPTDHSSLPHPPDDTGMSPDVCICSRRIVECRVQSEIDARVSLIVPPPHPELVTHPVLISCLGSGSLVSSCAPGVDRSWGVTAVRLKVWHL